MCMQVPNAMWCLSVMCMMWPCSNRTYSSVVVGGTTGIPVNLKSRASRAVQSASSSSSIHVQKGSHWDLAALGTSRTRETRTTHSFILLPLPSSARYVCISAALPGCKKGGGAATTARAAPGRSRTYDPVPYPRPQENRNHGRRRLGVAAGRHGRRRP